MFTNKSIAIIFITLSMGVAALLFHPASAQAALYNASGVLGQTDFTSSDATTTQNGLNYPAGAALDTINHRLFVDDCTSRRELVFQLDTNNNITTTSAAYVLGQPNFTANTATTTQSGMSQSSFCSPYGGPAYDPTNNRLFVPDFPNNRVMIFNVLPSTITNGENASYVLGQTDFTSSDATTTQSGFEGADGLAYDPTNNRLFLVDQNNNRVLVFNVAPSTIANGENASYVLGQPNFTSRTATTTRSGLHNAVGLAYDTTTNRLFVADSGNNRVMIFNVLPSTITNGENASYVLGQPDFISGNATTTQSGLSFPDGVAFDPTFSRVFIADDSGNRTLVFDANPSTITNGENAENVLGQTDFTSSDAPTTQSSLNDPEGNLAYDSTNHKLFVPDSSNNRVLQFSFISFVTSSLPGGTVGSSYSQALATANSQGSVSFSPYSGSLPAGLSLATSTGVISGTPTAAGTSSFTIEADDGFSTGNFFDRKDYSITVAGAPSPTPAPIGGGGGGYTTYNGLVLSTTPAVKPTPTPGNAPNGLPFSGPNTPAGLSTSFPSGTLVNDHGTIYLISGQTKMGFTSMAAFRGLGYKLQNVILGDASGYEASQTHILDSALMAHPWGSWLLYKKTVYYATAQGVIPVPSWPTLLSNGGLAKYIVPMNSADLKAFQANPTLPVMTAADSRVVR